MTLKKTQERESNPFLDPEERPRTSDLEKIKAVTKKMGRASIAKEIPTTLLKSIMQSLYILSYELNENGESDLSAKTKAQAKYFVDFLKDPKFMQGFGKNLLLDNKDSDVLKKTKMEWGDSRKR